MLKKFIYFIKYNNATIFLLVFILIFGGSVFASEAGKEALGQKSTVVQGVDNTLLLQADLENFNMEYKIERIESDDLYYYVTFTFIDLNEINNVWQYELKEKTRKVSKKIKKDLGIYLAEELNEENNLRISELKGEQADALMVGEQKRVETVEYSGIIGAILDTTGKIFPGYEPVIKTEIASPSILHNREDVSQPIDNASTTVIVEPNTFLNAFEDFFQNNDTDSDGIISNLDNCFEVPNPDQLDSDNNGIGDVCETETSVASTTPDILNNDNITNVEIIDLTSSSTSTN